MIGKFFHAKVGLLAEAAVALLHVKVVWGTETKQMKHKHKPDLKIWTWTQSSVCQKFVFSLSLY